MRALALLFFLALCGCERVGAPIVDQCLRRQIFAECLAALPKGPSHVVSNDWDEVVSECSSTAYYMALRRDVRVECRSQ